MLNITKPYTRDIYDNAQRSFVEDLQQRERARMDEYIKMREYYDGIHKTQLNERTKAFLNVSDDRDFTVNYCPIVVNSKAERLKVTGLEVEESQSEVLWDWWNKNRMDKKQGDVHHAAIRDGDAFVLVEYDQNAKMPRFYYEPAYAGEGVMAYYSDERRDEIEFASKHWIIKRGLDTGKLWRKNLYFPNRVEKYIAKDEHKHWMPYLDPNDPNQIEAPGYLGMAGISWWTMDGTENGEPLGVPIVHFKYNSNGEQFGTSRLVNVTPLQDALNKTMIDLLGVADTTGFPLTVGFGTNWSGIKVTPGALVWTPEKKTDSDLKRLPAEGLDHLSAFYNQVVTEIARVSGTPLSYFQMSSQVAAEGTLKQQEITLLSQLEKCQVDFGNAWEDCLNIARRLEMAFGSETLDLNESIEMVWKEAALRNEKEQVETLAIKVTTLGVTEKQAQIEMGYDEEQIAEFERAKLRNRALALRQIPNTFNNQSQNGNQDETLTATENDNGTVPQQ